jgi:hypothetical protein
MTDIATNLNTIDGSLSDIKTAIVNKGGTVSGNITTFATAIDNIPSGGGGGKYALLDRVIDDNGNEIGTVSGFFTDANDTEYAVVCLDAQYRATSLAASSSTSPIANLPTYYNVGVYSARETSTFNTDCLIASNSSPSATHCRSKFFVIDNVTYYGQLPNLTEVLDIYRWRPEINSADTSPSQYSDMLIPNTAAFPFYKVWSSTLYMNTGSNNNIWQLNSGPWIRNEDGTTNGFVIPVLEIPN